MFTITPQERVPRSRGPVQNLRARVPKMPGTRERGNAKPRTRVHLWYFPPQIKCTGISFAVTVMQAAGGPTGVGDGEQAAAGGQQARGIRPTLALRQPAPGGDRPTVDVLSTTTTRHLPAAGDTQTSRSGEFYYILFRAPLEVPF